LKLLKNKNALVTGSNRGIGKEIIKVFAENGASIWACARKKNKSFSDNIKNLAKVHSVVIKPLYFDINNISEVKKAFNEIYKEKKTIDILVNNAGVSHAGLFQMTSLEKIKEIFNTNFIAQVSIIQFASKFLIRQKKGVIVNLTSVVGIDGYTGNVAYGSSKAAFINFTKTLVKELSQFGIRVNGVAPGMTQTSMADEFGKNTREIMLKENPLKRLAEPREIANVVLFLSSELSSYVNGQIIRVDGGL